MAEEVNAPPNGELPASYPCPCHATKMKCPERISSRNGESTPLVSIYDLASAHRLACRSGFTSERWFLPAAMECRVGAKCSRRCTADERLKRHSDDHIGSESITRRHAVKSAATRGQRPMKKRCELAHRRQVGERERQKPADVNESREYDRAASYQHAYRKAPLVVPVQRPLENVEE